LQKRVLVIEERPGLGIRIVKGITTSTNTAFHQITTRRTVDFAKYGVRSAASPYIGKLNNERVRAALKSTITSFLQEMLDDEMLVAFEVDVFATRADEIKGIANVTILLQPTFSIDFIKVTMFLS
jgi:phage tail sheath protein FI